MFREHKPDLVLLDLMLPGHGRHRRVPAIRAESGVPIVMLTAKTDTIDVVVGLESGADDYVVKPFKPKELVARIRARLRRTEEPAPELLEIGDLVIDVAGHSVKRDGEPIALTPLEFDLLVALARKPWQVFTREVLLEQVWGYRHAADTRLVNVHVQRLRSKIEQRPGAPRDRRHRPRRRLQGGPGLSTDDPPPTAPRAAPPGPGRVPSRRSAGAGAGRSRLWRRSLQLRVVTTTDGAVRCIVDRACSATSCSPRCVDGLLDAKRRRPPWPRRRPARRTAQEAFDSADRSEPDGLRHRSSRDLVRQLSRGGGPAGAHEVVLLRGPTTSTAPDAPLGRSSSGVDVRRRRRGRCASRSQTTGRPAVDLQRADPGRRPARSRSSSSARRSSIPTVGAYELYFLFPLDQEQDTLGLVRSALLLAALGLVLLVGGIAWLVTRQVVTPVRLAARIAERLAAGRLEERMRVRGEDDLARLAASFNRMATSLQRQIRQLEDLSRVQRRFVSDVSHELRTPLTTVRMAADVLHEARTGLRPGGRAQRRAAAGPARPVRGAARRPAGDQPVRRRRRRARGRSRPTCAVVAAARDRGDGAAGRAPGQPRRRCSRRRCPCVAEVDAARIERILRNLVVNAIEHGEGRPIDRPGRGRRATRSRSPCATTASGSSPARSAWCSTGSGGPTRPGPAPPAAPGSGLSIALEDAHLHGGWLQAWGEPGDGCAVPAHAAARARRRAGGVADPARADGLRPAPAAGDRRRAVPPDPHPGRRRCLSRRCARSPAGRAAARAGGRRAARGLRDDPDLRPGQGRRRPAAAAGRRRRAGHRAAPDARAPRPEDIVLGFLQSSADFRADHEIAREYLTPSARQRWRPAGGHRRLRRPGRPAADGRRDRHGRGLPRSAASTARAPSGGRRPGPRQPRRSAWSRSRRVADRHPGRRADAVRGGRRGDLPPGLAVLPGAHRAGPGARPSCWCRSCPASPPSWWPGCSADRRPACATPSTRRSRRGPTSRSARCPVRDGVATVRLNRAALPADDQDPGADVGADRLDPQAAVRGPRGADHRGRR